MRKSLLLSLAVIGISLPWAHGALPSNFGMYEFLENPGYKAYAIRYNTRILTPEQRTVIFEDLERKSLELVRQGEQLSDLSSMPKARLEEVLLCINKKAEELYGAFNSDPLNRSYKQLNGISPYSAIAEDTPFVMAKSAVGKCWTKTPHHEFDMEQITNVSKEALLEVAVGGKALVNAVGIAIEKLLIECKEKEAGTMK